MKWLNRIISLALIGLSVLIFFSSLKLRIGGAHNPGPGFMPFIVSVILFALSVWVLIVEMRRSDEDKEKRPSIVWKNFRQPVYWVIMLSAYILLLETLGYLISTFLLMFLMFFISEPKKWYMHIVIAAFIASLSFFAFYKWLLVPLPIGILRIIR